jgi:protein-tyrosine-phosphatase
LVVCHGNICRSPFAAALLARNAAANGTARSVTSGGFITPGRRPPEPALISSAARNVDLHDHRSALVTDRAANSADLIVAMSPEQESAIRRRYGLADRIIILGDLDPLPIPARTIRDPWGQSLTVFEESYERIERCVAELERILARSSAARASADKKREPT